MKSGEMPSETQLGNQPASSGALDRPFTATLFTSVAAKTKKEKQFSLRTFARLIETTSAPDKGSLPWLKLARFGTLKTESKCLRHDSNVQAITGIEADYDGEQLSVEHAYERLTQAGLLSLLYTSARHSEAKPRWRLLCPTSVEMPPNKRQPLMGRLNGLFSGIFSPESWTLSQSYYYGRVQSCAPTQIRLIEGQPIDELDELDAIWLGKSSTGANGGGQTSDRNPGPLNEAALLADIIGGHAYHSSCVRLLGKWAREGVAYMGARTQLFEAFDAVAIENRDDRWHQRRGDIDRCVDDIYVKEAGARDTSKHSLRGRSAARAITDEADEPWPLPLDFMGDGELTGTPELQPGMIPEVIYAFAVDTAGRMGVDPVSVALAALVTCASVISEDWRVQPKRFDPTWTEAARLWGAIVGDPSILKSPVIAVCTRPIERLDADARDRHGEQMRSYKEQVASWKEVGSDPKTMPRPPVLERYMVEGTTVEALSETLRSDGEGLQCAPCGRVLVRQDEMSEWLASFDRYRSGGRGGADRGAYLRLFNGGRYVIDRINRGSFAVVHWSACILGGIQPEPIQRIAREAADDGLLQRFLYCVPARQDQGEDRAPDKLALARYEALIPALLGLHPARLLGSGDLVTPAEPRPVVMHADAHQHRIAINDLVHAMSALPDTSSRLRAALGKWPGVFARLALTLHLIDAADIRVQGGRPAPLEVLSEATARRAASLLRSVLLPHLLRAEGVMFSSTQSGHARWIAGLILSRGQPRLALRDVVQAYGPLRSPESRRELLEVMESLVTVGWLRPEAQSNPARPTAAWSVNPAVHQHFALRAERERAARRAAQLRLADCLSHLPGSK